MSRAEIVVLDNCDSYEALENAQKNGCVLQLSSLEYAGRDECRIHGWSDFEEHARKYGSTLQSFPASRYRAVIRHALEAEQEQIEDLENELAIAKHQLAVLPQLLESAGEAEQEPVAWYTVAIDGRPKEFMGAADAEALQEQGITTVPVFTAPPAQAAAVPDEVRTALEYYAKGEHMLGDWDNWESCSGEPQNILWPLSDEPQGLEDGSIAKHALAQLSAPFPTEKAAPVELAGVAEQLAEDEGWWQTCTGCYESEDGHPCGHYPYSTTLKCRIGHGCSECGGIGAVWELAPAAPVTGEKARHVFKDEGEVQALVGEGKADE